MNRAAASRRPGPSSTSRCYGLNQSFIKTGASFFGGTGAGASSAGRGRGSGVDDGRCGGAPVSPKWFNQVAIADSGDGASGGAAGVAWAWAEANSKKDRENAVVFSEVI